MYARYKVMCGCECCISSKSIRPSLLSRRDYYLKNLKDLSQNAQNIRSGEMANRLFETYKNSVMPHDHHIYATASDIYLAKICAYSLSQYALPHWKCLLCFCYNLPHIDLPVQESDRHNFNTSPSISFHIYRLILCFIVHGRRPLY